MRAFVVFVAVWSGACTCAGPRIQRVHEEEDAGSPCIPQAEECNGRDDDCDQSVDEDQPMLECGMGECRRALASCKDGTRQTCVPGTPSAEACNGKDDDCNGEPDDRLMPTMCGVGECALVSSSCVMGQPQVCRPADAGVELCNGKDDDCDGTVDEGLLANTSGDLRITNNSATSDFVYLASSPTGFALAWQDTRDGAMKGDVYFAPLDKQGRRQGGDVRVTSSSGISTHPAMAFAANKWGLVYADDSAGNLELWFRPISPSGQPLGIPVRLTQAAGDSDWPDVVWTGSEFAVVWEDERAGTSHSDLFFLRFDANGNRVGNEVRLTNDRPRQGYPILKWSGQRFGIAWTDWRDGNREIYYRQLDAAGQPLGNELRVTNNPADSAWPDLSWNATRREWALVWHDARDGNSEIYFQRLDEQGVRIGTEVRLTNANGFSGYPSIDWNGFEYGVSWQDDRAQANVTAIYFMQVSAVGAKNGNDIRLSSGSAPATFTTALWNGSTFAFAWRDSRDAPAGNTELYFAYVGCP